MPQQRFAHTTAPGVASDDRRRFDPVIYGATPLGGAICCDATLLSPLRRDGTPHAGAPARDGAVLQVAERRKRTTYPELAQGGAQSLCVLGCEVISFVLRLVSLCSCRVHRPCAVPRAARARRWWSVLSAAVQQAIGPHGTRPSACCARASAKPGAGLGRGGGTCADSVSRLPLLCLPGFLIRDPIY